MRLVRLSSLRPPSPLCSRCQRRRGALAGRWDCGSIGVIEYRLCQWCQGHESRRKKRRKRKEVEHAGVEQEG